MNDNKYNRIEALELFKDLDIKIQNTLDNSNLDASYFENIAKKWQKRIDKKKIEQDCLKMNFEKLHKPFTI